MKNLFKFNILLLIGILLFSYKAHSQDVHVLRSTHMYIYEVTDKQTNKSQLKNDAPIKSVLTLDLNNDKGNLFIDFIESTRSNDFDIIEYETREDVLALVISMVDSTENSYLLIFKTGNYHLFLNGNNDVFYTFTR